MNKRLNWKQFINFWKQYYKENRYCKDREFYDIVLKKRGNYGIEDIYKFIQWKFEGPMGRQKIGENWKSIWKSKVEINIDKINDFCKRKDLNFTNFINFSETVRIFNTAPIVGKALIGHICHPKNLPLLDKYVFIAHKFLSSKKYRCKERSISLEGPQSYNDYKNYRKFVLKIKKRNNLNLRDIDKGLLAFGQFLTCRLHNVKYLSHF